jgi:hypothetical protein
LNKRQFLAGILGGTLFPYEIALGEIKTYQSPHTHVDLATEQAIDVSAPFSASASSGQTQHPLTLGSIKSAYLNKRIVILGHPVMIGNQNVLQDWEFAKKGRR